MQRGDALDDRADHDLTDALQWEASLRSYLYRFASRPDDVADLLQDTYARVLVASRRGEIKVRPIRAFLFRTAHNVAIDWLRHRNVVPMRSLGDFEPLPVYSALLPVEDRVSTQEELEMFTRALEELPPRCREVFTLRRVYGYSQKEIAARLNIQEGTVEQHISTALQRLDDALARGPIGRDPGSLILTLRRRVRSA